MRRPRPPKVRRLLLCPRCRRRSLNRLNPRKLRRPLPFLRQGFPRTRRPQRARVPRTQRRPGRQILPSRHHQRRERRSQFDHRSKCRPSSGHRSKLQDLVLHSSRQWSAQGVLQRESQLYCAESRTMSAPVWMALWRAREDPFERRSCIGVRQRSCVAGVIAAVTQLRENGSRLRAPQASIRGA
jgi:hypothetical protein